MSLSQGLRWSGKGISSGRRRLVVGRNEIRQFSYNTYRPHLSQSLRPQNPRLASRPSSLQQYRSLSLFGWGSSNPPSNEFATAHTSPHATPPTTNIGQLPESTTAALDTPRAIKASHATSDSPDPSILQSQPVSVTEPAALKSLEDSVALPHGTPTPELLADAAEPDLASIPEGIGYLKDVCALDYGWGPTSMIEWTVEHLHIYAGLSWSASIVAVAVIARLIAFRWTVKASDQNIRAREVKPILDPLRAQYKEALVQQDRARAMAIGTEIRTISKEAGVKTWLMLAPMLIQVPLTFGGFRLLRGAATLPVPAFETESWLWRTDLTLGDPFILPVVNGLLTYMTIQSNMGSGQGSFSPQVMKLMTYGLPAISLVFIHYQAGAVQLWFLINSLFSFVQSLLLRNATFRKMAGLLPMQPPPDTASSTTTDAPLLGGMAMRKNAKSEATEDGPGSNRSLIDRVVDGFKSKRDDVGSSFSKTWEAALGSQKDRVKDRQKAQMDKYEYARRQDLENQRQYRNQAAASASSAVPDKMAGQVAGMRTSKSIEQKSQKGI